MALENLIPKEPTKFDQIERWVGFIKNIGLIIGIPVLFVVGMRLNDARVEALEAQIELLKERSVITAANEVRAYRDLLEAQSERLSTHIKKLQKEGVAADSLLADYLRLIEESWEKEYDVITVTYPVTGIDSVLGVLSNRDKLSSDTLTYFVIDGIRQEND